MIVFSKEISKEKLCTMSYPENTRIIYCDDQVNTRFNLDIGNMTEWNASSHFNNEYELHIILENSVAFSADNDPVVLNAESFKSTTVPILEAG